MNIAIPIHDRNENTNIKQVINTKKIGNNMKSHSSKLEQYVNHVTFIQSKEPKLENIRELLNVISDINTMKNIKNNSSGVITVTSTPQPMCQKIVNKSSLNVNTTPLDKYACGIEDDDLVTLSLDHSYDAHQSEDFADDVLLIEPIEQKKILPPNPALVHRGKLYHIYDHDQVIHGFL